MPEEVCQKIEKAISSSDYIRLGTILRENVITLTQVEELASRSKELKIPKLFRAARFVLSFEFIKGNLETKIGDLLQAALFIEHKLPDYMRKNRYYLPPSTTGLAYAIECDPKTGKKFILLNGIPGSYLGRGCKKVVLKCILYSDLQPEILARAEQPNLGKKEWRITQLFQGSKGLFITRALTRYTVKGIRYAAVYSQIYNRGAIYNIFDKCHEFSDREKMKMALNILTGLAALHKKNIVHRDLGIGNYLVDIGQAENPKKRKITAVISDLGRASEVAEVRGVFPQGNSLFVAPEGLFYDKMKGKEYFKTDVFAVGAMFYRIFYEKKAPWQKKRYLRDSLKKRKETYRQFLAEINADTQPRRLALLQKKTVRPLTPKEAFESLILKMVHSNPEKRGSASDLKEEMLRIYRQKELRVQ